MGDLSEHFSRSEFKCHGHGVKGHTAHPTVVDEGLVQLLELIRKAAGRPVRILSGHRCRWWNFRVGGVAGSQHVLGKAADIPEGLVTPYIANKLGSMGTGVRGKWAVHVDRRPEKARWTY